MTERNSFADIIERLSRLAHEQRKRSTGEAKQRAMRALRARMDAFYRAVSARKLDHAGQILAAYTREWGEAPPEWREGAHAPSEMAPILRAARAINVAGWRVV